MIRLTLTSGHRCIPSGGQFASPPTGHQVFEHSNLSENFEGTIIVERVLSQLEDGRIFTGRREDGATSKSLAAIVHFMTESSYSMLWTRQAAALPIATSLQAVSTTCLMNAPTQRYSIPLLSRPAQPLGHSFIGNA